MRPAGQARGGFYPAPSAAVTHIAQRLSRPPDDGPCTILDPCAGEAEALLRLAELLRADPWAVELAEDRAEVVRARMPDGQALAPADFLAATISAKTFSAVYCNPPFDYQGGGMGRVEVGFIGRATTLLPTGGVLILVCPESVGYDFELWKHFETWYRNWSVFEFPEECRRYNEIVIMATRRSEPTNSFRYSSAYSWFAAISGKQTTYQLPVGRRPVVFCKGGPTDAEIARLVEASPARFLFDGAGQDLAKPMPPMSPGVGHRAMLLASGLIDGMICPKDEPPHLIRGTARKERFLSSVETIENPDGSTTDREVYCEKPTLVVRVLDHAGTIKTLEG